MKVLLNGKAYENDGFGIIKRIIGYTVSQDTSIFAVSIEDKELDKDNYTLVNENKTPLEIAISFYKDDEFIPIKRFLADSLQDEEQEEITYNFLKITLGETNLRANLLGLYGRPLF